MATAFDMAMRGPAGVLASTLAGMDVRATTMRLSGCSLLDLPLPQAAIDDFGVEMPQP